MTDHRDGSDMGCFPLSARIDDFARVGDIATKRTFTYSFISRQGVNFGNVVFSADDPYNLLDGAIQPGPNNTVFITFREDIHSQML